jgi:uncharacterized protein YgbK (DUF1537 family)
VTIALGCIADDYTGASDLANTLTRAGLRTVQTIGVPADGLTLPEADAVVVSLKTRAIAAPDAVARAREAGTWLQAGGAGHLLIKICSTFDSTDAGNIGPVTDALRDDRGGGIVVVTPAFPETGRTVYMGHLFVGAVPLHESPLKDHPLNPMRDADLRRVLARQSRGRVGHVDLMTVRSGIEAVRARLDSLAAAGASAAIVDAVFDGDLDTIGAVALGYGLSTGASGLGLGLARALIASGRVKAQVATLDDVTRPVGGYAAVVAGSCSAATLEQIAIAEAAMPVLRLDAGRLVIAGAQEVAMALAWARERLPAGPVLIAASDAPALVAALQSRYGREAAGTAIEGCTASIAEGLVTAGVRRLVVAGGETAGAAVDRLKIPAFVVGPEIAPGVPLLRTVGAGGADMLLALKSGNFGGARFFEAALGVMR